MILDIYTKTAQVGPLFGSARRLAKTLRHFERIHGPARAVFRQEEDYSPSQLAVLGAIADDQEQQLRELYTCAE